MLICSTQLSCGHLLLIIGANLEDVLQNWSLERSRAIRLVIVIECHFIGSIDDLLLE